MRDVILQSHRGYPPMDQDHLVIPRYRLNRQRAMTYRRLRDLYLAHLIGCDRCFVNHNGLTERGRTELDHNTISVICTDAVAILNAIANRLG